MSNFDVIRVLVLEKSVELFSSNEETLIWVELEIERNILFFGSIKIDRSERKWVKMSGFADEFHMSNFSLWLMGLLGQDEWEDYNQDKTGNMRWYRKKRIKRRKQK